MGRGDQTEQVDSERRVDNTEHNPRDCRFCQFARGDGVEVIAENEYAVAFYDSFPSSPGHTLFIPKRPVADYFDLTLQEQMALQKLLVEQKKLLDDSGHKPDGYNIGLNSNQYAGQTISHAHVHLIPRYEGDVDDPRGGIRHIIPQTAKYWER